MRLGHPHDQALNSLFPNVKFVLNINSDLWGPTPINSVNGFKYYILFVDHYTRFGWLYLLQIKCLC